MRKWVDNFYLLGKKNHFPREIQLSKICKNVVNRLKSTVVFTREIFLENSEILRTTGRTILINYYTISYLKTRYFLHTCS